MLDQRWYVTTFQNDLVTWLIGLPTDEIKTSTATGQPNKVSTIHRVFETTGQLASATQSWTDGATTKFNTHEFVPNIFGLVSQEKVSGTNVPLTTTNFTNFDIQIIFPTRVQNALGQIEYMTYDSRFGLPLTVQDVDGLTTSYAYDAFGRIIQTTTPDGVVSTTSYCQSLLPAAISPSNSTHLTVTTQTGQPTIYHFFDARDREIRMATQGFDDKYILRNRTFNDRLYLISASEPYYVNAAGAATPYWNATAATARAQVSTFQLGNGLSTQRSFNPNTGQLAAIGTGTGEAVALGLMGWSAPQSSPGKSIIQFGLLKAGTERGSSTLYALKFLCYKKTNILFGAPIHPSWPIGLSLPL